MELKKSWEETRERVREAADIVQVIGEHVQLRRAGANYTGLCPFHGEKTPSFSVNPQRQHYKCFGCGESGDVFSFLMKHQNLSYVDALKELAKRHQISLPELKLNEAEQERRQRRELLYAINTKAARLCHEHLTTSPDAEAARQYLQRRGVPQTFIIQYQLGFAPDSWDFISTRLAAKFSPEMLEQAGLIVRRNSGKGFYDRFRARLLFPILDHSGRVCAFGGRVLGDGQPKYMNSPESPVFEKGRLLFGLHQHREAIRQSRRAVIVEGNFDLLLLDVHGISNTVAPLGTSLTKEHVRALRGLCAEAVLLFDGDAAGLRAARRAVPIFLAEGLEAKAALLPAGHDPDSFVREHGADAVRQLLDKADPLPEFIYDALAKEHGYTLAGKSKIMAELAELVKLVVDPAQRELMAAHFAGKLGVSAEHFLPKTELKEMEQSPFPFFDPAEEQQVPPPALEETAPLSALEQRLLYMLVCYPEHFSTLIKEGLLECMISFAPPVQEIAAAMRTLAEAGQFAPEQLLSVLPDGSARQQVVNLLRQGTGSSSRQLQELSELHNATDVFDDEDEYKNLDDLCAWFRARNKQRLNAELLRQQSQAVQSGDEEMVRKLQLKIISLRQETADF
ncbi:DNA primase [Candidatus Electronema sp. TJ]|uniref:DNA primase n=1 Tax=Candidatus Electronema sp. TJ TaxID=3401573 RepID=UPI003AA902F0